jgi:ornithine cyclodeaminase/alanine dehydrogenase-like protein (mu-crystallin family)
LARGAIVSPPLRPPCLANEKMGPIMTLILNNDDVKKVLTMDMTIAALEKSYLDIASGEAVCRPRIDMRIPTKDPKKNYQT